MLRFSLTAIFHCPVPGKVCGWWLTVIVFNLIYNAVSFNIYLP